VIGSRQIPSVALGQEERSGAMLRWHRNRRPRGAGGGCAVSASSSSRRRRGCGPAANLVNARPDTPSTADKARYRRRCSRKSNLRHVSQTTRDVVSQVLRVSVAPCQRTCTLPPTLSTQASLSVDPSSAAFYGGPALGVFAAHPEIGAISTTTASRRRGISGLSIVRYPATLQDCSRIPALKSTAHSLPTALEMIVRSILRSWLYCPDHWSSS
jgi:hypothetical protein